MDNQEHAANWTQCMAFYKKIHALLLPSISVHVCTASPPPRQKHRV